MSNTVRTRKIHGGVDQGHGIGSEVLYSGNPPIQVHYHTAHNLEFSLPRVRK